MDPNEEDQNRYSKRRRLDWNGSFAVPPPHLQTRSYRRKTTIMHLPPEVLQNIFRWIPTKCLATNVRLVSKYFRENVNIYFNIKFFQFVPRLMKVYMFINEQFFQVEPDVKRKLFRIISCLEILSHQFKILESSIWRYVRKMEAEFVFCAGASKIFDCFDRILYKIYTKPKEFKLVTRSYNLLQYLCRLVKSYIYNFEKHIEIVLNKDCFASGAKICDILDCCSFAERKVLYENIENEMCSLKVKYSLPNAWFTVLPVNLTMESERYTWQEKQRLMYLRLRRLVLAHTALHLDYDQWNRGMLVTVPGTLPPIKPPSSLYCGFGEFGEELYYYGVYNTGAIEYKIRKLEHRTPTEDDVRDKHVDIVVTLTCPIDQAPLYIYRNYNLQFERKFAQKNAVPRRTRQQKSAFHLQVEFDSELVENTFMESKYIFEVSEKDRIDIEEASKH